MSDAGLISTSGHPVPLRGVHVKAEVLGGHARVLVRQRYQNAESSPIEAVYTFPLPADATLSGFAMACEGRRLEGVVREREQAFRDYDEAVFQGHGAALLEQERRNVFTASVGNLLPGEQTVVEVEYLQRLHADEGALRFMLPTLVAPRYVPGTPQGDRTGGGRAEPTDRVPDADRITPRIGEVDYGLQFDLTFALPGALEIESPSHEIRIDEREGRTHVSFSRGEAALDRDVVVLARGVQDAPVAGVAAHRTEDGPGWFALSVVPDLQRPGRAPRQDVVFVIDTSGSMGGASLPQAQAALRLCLRHLREGDTFNVVEFNSTHRAFSPRPVAYSQQSLERADRWVASLRATGGTELLAPLVEAVKGSPDGVVVLLTDGQVGNEQEILQAVLGTRGKARVYSFGIGTNVSDELLRDLARHTGGHVEFIHPGERIDEKVVATFARALAPRVDSLRARFVGLEVGELAPQEPAPMIDGEPWVLMGRYASPGEGRVELRGSIEGEPFALDVPMRLPDRDESNSALRRLWATERIRDLEAAKLSGRRADAMKERIVRLAVEHGVSSPYTSFLVIEEREGDRRAQGAPETRFVPVNLPAGWEMFDMEPPGRRMVHHMMPGVMAGAMFDLSPPVSAPSARARVGLTAPPTPSPARTAAKASNGGVGRALRELFSKHSRKDEQPTDRPLLASDSVVDTHESPPSRAPTPPVDAAHLLSLQLASGLWDDAHGGGDLDERRVRATANALLDLLELGVTSGDPMHGAQVKKAIEALLKLVADVARRNPRLAQLALAAAWLVSSGRRTRGTVESLVRAAPELAPIAEHFGDEASLRAHVAALRG